MYRPKVKLQRGGSQELGWTASFVLQRAKAKLSVMPFCASLDGDVGSVGALTPAHKTDSVLLQVVPFCVLEPLLRPGNELDNPVKDEIVLVLFLRHPEKGLLLK